VDEDCCLGFRLGSQGRLADRDHRGQEAQAQCAFIGLHSHIPSFGGGYGASRSVWSESSQLKDVKGAAWTNRAGGRRGSLEHRIGDDHLMQDQTVADVWLG
jgi:hypothetical protein